jgi:endonuclease/exonuclease/phosphatase family metal-dependent hydrolase
MTTLKMGRMNEIADEMSKIQLQRIALQELRWKEVRQINKTKYKLYYTSNQEKAGILRIGFTIQNEIKKDVLSFEPYNERLCKLRLKGNFNNLSIISVHAPTEEKSDEEKEKFYEDLQIVHNKIPKHYTVIILGDLNAEVRKEEVNQNAVGKHRFHETSNRNGEWVCEYAIANNRRVISIYYKQKNP